MIRFLIYILILLTNQCYAINCKHVSKKWEQTVCENPTLVRLENKLNSVLQGSRSQSVQSDMCAQSQSDIDEWHDALPDLNKDELVSTYDNLIDEVSYCNGLAKTIYYAPDQREINELKPSIKFKLAAVQLNRKTIIEYPVLLENIDKNVLESINKVIRDTAYLYIDGMPYNNEGVSYNVYTSIIAANSGLFGVDIPTGEGNASTGYGGQSYSERHLWNLKNGEDLIDIYDVDTYSIKKDKKKIFWKTVLKNNYPVTTSEGCQGYDKNYVSVSFYTNDSMLQASDAATSGADYHQHCGNIYDVPYEKVKNYIIFNKKFIQYLPRLIAAGLIKPEFGNKILLDQRKAS